MSSIFTKIISGEIPSYKVYEDDHVFAFLDIKPIQDGHVLVVPKFSNQEVDYLFDLNDQQYSELFSSVKIVAKILKEKLKCKRVCMMVEGYAVPHVHIHLIPTNTEDDLKKEFRVREPKTEDLERLQKMILG